MMKTKKRLRLKKKKDTKHMKKLMQVTLCKLTTETTINKESMLWELKKILLSLTNLVMSILNVSTRMFWWSTKLQVSFSLKKKELNVNLWFLLKLKKLNLLWHQMNFPKKKISMLYNLSTTTLQWTLNKNFWVKFI